MLEVAGSIMLRGRPILSKGLLALTLSKAMGDRVGGDRVNHSHPNVSRAMSAG